ncbi:MAG: hypothetical protein VR68_12045 [Peptococcaceae bacterium BRH_c4a]|nr:MAG: hypothetical protein VR68_12045 [Peptococcaceae bacterium BRH_c4a]
MEIGEKIKLIEKIGYNGELFAIIIRCSFSPKGTSFITSNDNFLQVGVFVHEQGKQITPHFHKEFARSINLTQEVLHLEYGKIEASFFKEGKEVAKSVLSGGDTIILLNGGHGFNALEETKMIEVKQGPYSGHDKDKEMIF